jgi:hypothetical protein
VITAIGFKMGFDDPVPLTYVWNIE